MRKAALAVPWLLVTIGLWSGPWMATSSAGQNTPSPLAGKSLSDLATILNGNPAEVARHEAVKAIAADLPAKTRRGERPPKVKPDYAAANEKIVPVLIAGLGDKAGSVRYACREALGRCGAAAVGPLTEALASDNVDIRRCAADALGDIGVYDDSEAQPLDKAVPALARLLDDKNYAVRVSAAMALARIGERAAPALPKLIPLLDDPEWAVADAAVQAVAAADPDGKQSVPALVKVLESSRHDLREFVCAELAEMGPKAEAAIPTLIKLLDTDRGSWQAGKAAAGALAIIVSIDPKAPQAPGVSPETRTIVIAAIAKSAAGAKAPFVQDDRLHVLLPKLGRTYGPGYTGPLGPEALPALPLALARLKSWSISYSPWVPRRELIAFIAEVGPYAKDTAAPAVKALLADKNLDPKADTKELQGLLSKLEK